MPDDAGIELARANLTALLADITDRGVALEGITADGITAMHGGRPGYYWFDLQLRAGYETELELPGVPLAQVRGPEADCPVKFEFREYSWEDALEAVIYRLEGLRALEDNLALVRRELAVRGAEVTEVTSDVDACGDGYEAYVMCVNGREVEVGILDVPVGPGLAAEGVFVEGDGHAWATAVDAILEAAAA